LEEISDGNEGENVLGRGWAGRKKESKHLRPETGSTTGRLEWGGWFSLVFLLGGRKLPGRTGKKACEREWGVRRAFEPRCDDNGSFRGGGRSKMKTRGKQVTRA